MNYGTEEQEQRRLFVMADGLCVDAVGPADLGQRLSYGAWSRPGPNRHDGGLCKVVILALASRPLRRGARAY